MIIAIDGPAGSGKGTIASLVSKKLNLINIDTGATYRCVALAVIRKNLNIEDENLIGKLSAKLDIKLASDGRVFLDGEDVTKAIREKDVTKIVSKVSSNIKVRENMVNIQRKMAENNNVIMEGRDITTVVFPNAKYKFYLDASLEERTKRRYLQNKENKIDMSYDEIYDNIAKRDYNDMHKKVGALKKAEDAIIIDSTNLTIEEVTDKVIEEIEKLK